MRMDCAGGERAAWMASGCWLGSPKRVLRLGERRPVRLWAVGRGADDGEGEKSRAGRPAPDHHDEQHVVWSAEQLRRGFFGHDREPAGDSPGRNVPAEADDSQPEPVQCTTEQHGTAGQSQVRAAHHTHTHAAAFSSERSVFRESIQLLPTYVALHAST